MTSLAPRRVGRYALYGVLGSGGMAMVHLGKLIGEAGFSRTVAVKRLHDALAHDGNLVMMMADEARVVSRIRHPNVVPTLDAVVTDGELYVVMEYIHGASLAQLLGEEPTTRAAPAGIAAAIVLDVLAGLQAAHVATDESGALLGLVHRDISPQNVLVGSDGVARVIDFGIAKARGRNHHTETGQIKGKPYYMAPEQLLGEPVDARADVYAVGVVFWEALTGRPLFEADSHVNLIRAVLSGELRPPSVAAQGRSLDRALDDVVMKALARDPNDRYPTAQAFALAIEAAMPNIPRARDVGAFVVEHAAETLAVQAASVALVEASPSPISRPPPTEDAALVATRPELVPPLPEITRRLEHFVRPSQDVLPTIDRTISFGVAIGLGLAFFIGVLTFVGVSLVKRSDCNPPYTVNLAGEVQWKASCN